MADEHVLDFAARGLQQLVDEPREHLGCEIKDWYDLSGDLNRAKVAKEIVALANYGGGHLIFGLSEQADGSYVASEREFDRAMYTQDCLNDLGKKYLDPGFECDVFPAQSRLGGEQVIVSVPGSHRAPIRMRKGGPNGCGINKGTIYVRRPGPESGPLTTHEDWDRLVEQCIGARTNELLDRFREIVRAMRSTSAADEVLDLVYDAANSGQAVSPAKGGSAVQGPTLVKADVSLSEWEQDGRDRLAQRLRNELPDEVPDRYAAGMYTMSYRLIGLDVPLSLPRLREGILKAHRSDTGWPVWMWADWKEHAHPKPVDGVIECWMRDSEVFSDGAHSDFWRASPDGMMFLLRGYQEDSMPESISPEPGVAFSPTLPVWRVAEGLRHAHRLATNLGSSEIEFLVRWTGLAGRQLVELPSSRVHLPWNSLSAQDEVRSSITARTVAIPDTLPELVQQIVEPLLHVFDFFDPPPSFYQGELSELLRTAGA